MRLGLRTGVAAVLGLVACGHIRTTDAVRLDEARIASIKPGVTTLSEILTMLGPPDAIIDGSQRVHTSTGIRTVTAPEAAVILCYLSGDSGTTFGPPAIASRQSDMTMARELAIVLSKNARVVISVTRRLPER